MKSLRNTRIVLAVVLTLLATAGVSTACAQSTSFPQKTSARAVFIGHSLINYQMPAFFVQIAQSKGLYAETAVQVINGAPLSHNWQNCRQSQFTGQYPPKDFACDAIERGTAGGPFDVLIATDANNSIESNRIYNTPQRWLEEFMNLLLPRKPGAKSFVFTSWESWGYHKSGTWLDAIPSELSQYELIAREAQALSAQRGQNGTVDVIPANLALRDLILEIQQGRVPGLATYSDLFADDVHMNKAGNYFIACVVFSAVYNQTPAGAATKMLDAYGGVDLDLSPATAQAMQAQAWKTVSQYRGGVVATPVRPKAPTRLTVQ
jgi:hypothetical protein